LDGALVSSFLPPQETSKPTSNKTKLIFFMSEYYKVVKMLNLWPFSWKI